MLPIQRTDFAPFMSIVSASEHCLGEAGTASQMSRILETQITGRGTAEATADTQLLGSRFMRKLTPLQRNLSGF